MHEGGGRWVGSNKVVELKKKERVNLPVTLDTWVPFLGGEDPLEKGMATHSSILAWRIPWTEKPGGLQFTGSQKSQTHKLPSTEHINRLGLGNSPCLKASRGGSGATA